jgi:hypothetical protein
VELERDYSPKNKVSQETRRSIQRVELYDIDGVVTNPVAKTFNHDVVRELAQKVQSGIVIGFNTGRSLEWSYHNVVDPLEKLVTDKEKLQNLYAVGEKGASWGKYVDGTWHAYTDVTVSVPEPLKEEIRQAVDEYQGANNSSVVYELDDKETMMTYEMRDGMAIEEFRQYQPEIAGVIQRSVERAGATLRVDQTQIAIDIEKPEVGKHLGARRVLDALEKEGVDFSQAHFATFGDSKSDIRMADEIHERGLPVEFVFVGNHKDLESVSAPYPVEKTQEMYDRGTLSYLMRSKKEKQNKINAA